MEKVVQEEGKSVHRAVTGEPNGWNAYAFSNDPDGSCSKAREMHSLIVPPDS